MPIKMGDTVQNVVIGDTMYIGGGDADSDRDSCTVMKLDLQREQWTTLPQYNAKWFAMTSLDDQLIVVGGLDPVTGKRTNQISMLQRKWTQPHPPMNIACHSSTAVSFNNHIIVAGGYDDQGCTSSVEVLDVTSRRWYIAEPLPNPRTYMKSTLIGSTLYLIGGWDQNDKTKVVNNVDLNELIDKAKTAKRATTSLWQTIEDTPLYYSAPLSIGSSLLAVGGLDNKHYSSSSIHLYQPNTRSWVRVGELPTTQFNCTCSVLPSEEIIVAGGNAAIGNLSIVHFLSIS